MKSSVFPGFRSESLKIPTSKSMAHRILICAALGKSSVILHFDGISNDILATIVCLRVLGAEIAELGGGDWRVTPILAAPKEECSLFCGESGSTLRFLLPIVGVLGARAVFHMEGRLPERPLEPLISILREHGMKIEKTGSFLKCSGILSGGIFEIPGNISSQYITGLLMALPYLSSGEAAVCDAAAQRQGLRLASGNVLRVTGDVESAAYIAMTEQVLRLAGARFEKHGWEYSIPCGQVYELPERTAVEGDWSNAAFFLCMGALSPAGVTVRGLRADSAQGDRAVLEVLRAMGAEVLPGTEGVTVRRGQLRGVAIDARPIPDLIPALCALAATAEGETQILHAGRLRLKESDRLASTAAMLRALGGDVEELPEGLRIRGVRRLRGGTVDACNDHRIAMAAAVAACACEEAVTVLGSECVDKSYPGFWEDLAALKGAEG